MRIKNSHRAGKLELGIILLSLFAFFSVRAEKVFEYSRFAGLYDRQQSFEETLERLNKMEDLRTAAQKSLERLRKARRGNLDLEMRYGELIVSRGRDLELFSGELENAGQAKRAHEIAQKSRALLKQGLTLHSKILVNAKKHPMVPKIYLGMARTQYSLGQKMAALRSADSGLKSLTSKNVRAVPEIEQSLLILMGDAAFDLSKAAIAAEAYSKALKKVAEASFEEAYVRYKLAWVEYNRKNSESALAHLDRLFEITRDRFALKNEAIQDYALFTADLNRNAIEKRGSFLGIYAYLSTVGDEVAAAKAFERISNTFAKNGRRSDAIEIQEFLISQDNSDQQNVDRALTIVEWAHSLADKKELVRRYFWLLQNFGPESNWYLAQNGKVQIQRKASDLIEASVRKFSMHLHQEAQKETSTDLRAKRESVVAKLYDAHLAAFAREQDVPRADSSRVHYYRAEIYRREKNFLKAGIHYDRYLRALDVVPKGLMSQVDKKLKDDAVWGSVQVWAKAIDKDPSLVPNMLGSADRFLKEKGSDPKAPQVLLDAALVEERAGNRVVSAKRLEALISKYPKSPQAAKAVHASLDILNKENDWINLAQRARLFLDSIDAWASASEKAKMKTDLRRILSQTEAKACDALAKEDERKIEAALCFEKFARGFANDAQAPKALLMAADLYDATKDPVSALHVLETLVKKYPESEHAAGGFSRLAQVYEKAFEFEKAITIYESLLSTNKEVENRARLTERLIVLLYSLGDEKRFKTWVSRKDTPDELKREFAERRAVLRLVQLRSEERKYGYDDKAQLVSSLARKLHAELLAHANSGKAQVNEMLELRRIKGIQYRLGGRLDKADEEWMAGLKLFWRSKKHTPADWESAARLRLEQGSVWETVFSNTDFLKNPGRKAELYQKLENWYAEVVEMKSPIVALSALWKSAELNSVFAEEIRNSPIPEELKVAGQEKNLEIYKKTLHEQTEPMKQKAIVIAQKIAEMAREWKVISPDVMTAMKMLTSLRSGEVLPGRLVRVAETDVLKFPWLNLPVWADLSPEQQNWKEWAYSSRELKKQLVGSNRAQSRRAAFVKLLRDESTQDSEVKKWSTTWVDRAGIQLRIQAMIHDQEFERANLFLDQYQSFFGEDAFSTHHYGKLEWAKGNYTQAYLKWVRGNAVSNSDFRTVYWNEGWNNLLDAMSSGELSDKVSKGGFTRMAPLAKTIWQKHYLAKLCVDGKLVCAEEFSQKNVANVLSLIPEPHASYKINSRDSGFDAQATAVRAFVARGLSGPVSVENISLMNTALTGLFHLAKFSDAAQEDVWTHYWTLRKNVEAYSEQADQLNKNQIIAGKGK